MYTLQLSSALYNCQQRLPLSIHTLKSSTHNTAYGTLKCSTLETQPSAFSHLSPTISQTLSRAPLLFLDQPAFQTPSSLCSLQSSIRTAPQCLSLLQGRWWSERPARESSTLKTRKVSGETVKQKKHTCDTDLHACSALHKPPACKVYTHAGLKVLVLTLKIMAYSLVSFVTTAPG